MYQIIQTDQTRDISSEVLQENGRLKLLPASLWQKYPWNDFRLFCHRHARYGIPTVELTDFLHGFIGHRTCIEIGAGHGDLGRHLGIHMTDSWLQANPWIAAKYAAVQQPTINYPDDVEQIDALDAVKKYQPQVVIASWITTYAPYPALYNSNPFGIREKEILELVDSLVIIGHKDIHGNKPIMQIPHRELPLSFLVSRKKEHEKNRVWIWDKPI